MRVKIGDTWHSPTPGCPIMVELEDLDKENIAGMSREMSMYACFHEDDGRGKIAMFDWMRDGARNGGLTNAAG